jgi:hypothetical protein
MSIKLYISKDQEGSRLLLLTVSTEQRMMIGVVSSGGHLTTASRWILTLEFSRTCKLHTLRSLSSSDDESKESMVSTQCTAADTARRPCHMHAYTIDDLAVGMNVPHCMILFSGLVEQHCSALFHFSVFSCADIKCAVEGRTWVTADRHSNNWISLPQAPGLSLRPGQSKEYDCRTSCESCREGVLVLFCS